MPPKQAPPSSCPFLADAGSCPCNCPGMEETTGAPSSFAVLSPRRLRASGRDGGGVMNRPPSPLQYAAFETYKAARVHRGARRRGGDVADRRARAAGRARCGASACSAAWPRTIRKRRPASRRSCKGCSNWAGSMAATCGSIIRWAAGDADRIRKIRGGIGRARAGRHPGRGSPTVAPLQQATRTVPIVFAHVADPVGAGFVDSLARPGGNATGFTLFEYGIERKMAGVAQGDRAAA